jgi:hypothetical protein
MSDHDYNETGPKFQPPTTIYSPVGWTLGIYKVSTVEVDLYSIENLYVYGMQNFDCSMTGDVDVEGRIDGPINLFLSASELVAQPYHIRYRTCSLQSKVLSFRVFNAYNVNGTWQNIKQLNFKMLGKLDRE